MTVVGGWGFTHDGKDYTTYSADVSSTLSQFGFNHREVVLDVVVHPLSTTFEFITVGARYVP